MQTSNTSKNKYLVTSSACNLLLNQIKCDISNKISKTATSIFLIGAATGFKTQGKSEKPLRNQVREALTTQGFYYRRMDVYYPELLFDELIHKFDLLELENFLANSVDAVVIVLESAGAIAELGAFANHKVFSKKLVVVVNKKHKKDKSFIMRGPVRLLKKNPPSKILFHNFSSPNIDQLVHNIRREVFSIKKAKAPNLIEVNPIEMQLFLLALLYLFESISKNELDAIIRSSLGEAEEEEQERELKLDDKEVYKIRTSSLAVLLKNGEISLTDSGYSLTNKGMDKLLYSILIAEKGSEIKKALDDIRVNVLEVKRKKVKIFTTIKGRSF